MTQTIQIKRTTTPNNAPASLALGEVALGLNDTPIKAWAGTPGGVRELFIRAHVGAAPVNPTIGDLWYDNTAIGAPSYESELKVWNGSAWELTTRARVAYAGPTPRVMADLWYSPAISDLLIWNGINWQPLNHVHWGMTPPTGVPDGTWWIHSTSYVLSLLTGNGTIWIPVTGARSHFGMVSAPTGGLGSGDIWWSPTGIQIYDGTQWFYAMIDGGEF